MACITMVFTIFPSVSAPPRILYSCSGLHIYQRTPARYIFLRLRITYINIKKAPQVGLQPLGRSYTKRYICAPFTFVSGIVSSGLISSKVSPAS